MKVLLLARYGRLGASSRLRYFQYLPYLESQGIIVEPSVFFDDGYVSTLMRSGLRPKGSVAEAYWRRIRRLLGPRDYDLVWVEYEALPWLPFWMERVFLNKDIPFVVEYDDAVFHRYDLHPRRWLRWLLSGKIPALMRHARLVIAGNDYIASRAKRAGAENIVVIPTAVDPRRYAPALEGGKGFTVGWIGSRITAPYLEMIRPALQRLAATGPLKLQVIGAEAPRWPGIDIQSVPWTEESEPREIAKFDVGVMPLPDEPWERGKCGYKLIQYMASAKPVVASPVGANVSIVTPGVEGFLAANSDEWVAGLERLRSDEALRFAMGRAGRAKVERSYSIDVTGAQLAAALRQAARVM